MLTENDSKLFFGYWWQDISQSHIVMEALQDKGQRDALTQSNEEMIQIFHDKTIDYLGGEFKRVRESYGLPELQPDSKSDALGERILRLMFELQPQDPSGKNIFTVLRDTDRGDFTPFLPEKYFLDGGMDPEGLKKLIAHGVMEEEPTEGPSRARTNPYQLIPNHIGKAQTCSAPYMVWTYNLLSQLTKNPGKIFEAGTGCGYQAVNFARLHPGVEVFGIDPHPTLCQLAHNNIVRSEDRVPGRLRERIHIQPGNILQGWTNNLFQTGQPYDVISFAFMLPFAFDLREFASQPHLNEGGTVIAPISDGEHPNTGELMVAYKTNGEVELGGVTSCQFVPAIM